MIEFFKNIFGNLKKTVTPNKFHENLRLMYLEDYHDSSVYVAIDVKGWDNVNRFVFEFVEMLKKYHPYELAEPDRCHFQGTGFTFDIDNPTVPRDVFNACENHFRISLNDKGKAPFCFWLDYSTKDQHDIFYNKDNAGSGFKLHIQAMGDEVRRKVIDFVFDFGGTVKGTKYKMSDALNYKEPDLSKAPDYIKNREIVDNITLDEKRELSKLRFDIELWGGYDHMESPEGNEICNKIGKQHETEMDKRKREILLAHGCDPETHVIWSDGVITKSPDNIDELVKESDAQMKQRQDDREQRQLDAMGKYGLTGGNP